MLIFISILLIFTGCKTAGSKEYFDDNFNVGQSNALKGLCAIFVIFHHLCTYLADVYREFFVFEKIGFLMVAMFFFISGYGLMYGVLNKKNYLKGFFSKRILTILIPYYIINLFYILSKYIIKILDKTYIIRSLFGYYQWYVMAILILYIGFWICFKIFKNKYGATAVTIYTFAYVMTMYILYKFFNMTDFGFWWYNSILCFVLGIWYCKFKSIINEFFKKHYGKILAITGTVFAVTLKYTSLKYNESTLPLLLAEIVCSSVFVIIIMMLSMKIQLGNKLISICGKLSLELYLSHALFIFFLRSDINIWGHNVYLSTDCLYLAGILTGTFIFSYVVNKASEFILKPLNSR